MPSCSSASALPLLPPIARPQDCRLIPTETPSKATANSRVALQRSKKPLHVHANICKQKMAFLDSLRRFEAERGFYIRQNCNNLGVFAVSRFGFRDQPVQPLWHPSNQFIMNILRCFKRRSFRLSETPMRRAIASCRQRESGATQTSSAKEQSFDLYPNAAQRSN